MNHTPHLRVFAHQTPRIKLQNDRASQMCISFFFHGQELATQFLVALSVRPVFWRSAFCLILMYMKQLKLYCYILYSQSPFWRMADNKTYAYVAHTPTAVCARSCSWSLWICIHRYSHCHQPGGFKESERAASPSYTKTTLQSEATAIEKYREQCQALRYGYMEADLVLYAMCLRATHHVQNSGNS